MSESPNVKPYESINKEAIKEVDKGAEAAAEAEKYAQAATSAAAGLSVGLLALKDVTSIVPGVGILFAAVNQLAVIYAKNVKLYALLMDINEILAQNFLMAQMIDSSMKIIESGVNTYNSDPNEQIEKIKIPTYVIERITTKINTLNEYLTRYIPANIEEGRDLSKFKFFGKESVGKFASFTKNKISSATNSVGKSFSSARQGLGNFFSRKNNYIAGQTGGGLIDSVSNFMSAGTIFENIHNHLNVMNAFFIIMNQRFDTIRVHYANHTNPKFKNHFNTVIWDQILTSTEYKNYTKEQTTKEIYIEMEKFNKNSKTVQAEAQKVVQNVIAAATTNVIEKPVDETPKNQYGGRTRRRRHNKKQTRKYRP